MRLQQVQPLKTGKKLEHRKVLLPCGVQLILEKTRLNPLFCGAEALIISSAMDDILSRVFRDFLPKRTSKGCSAAIYTMNVLKTQYDLYPDNVWRIPFISEKDAADILGISYHTLKRIRYSDGISYYRIGGRVFYRSHNLRDYVKGCEQGGESDG